jgi:CBS domain-containing protein
MTKDAISCPVEADTRTAAKLMLQGRFGTLPVSDAHGKVVGVITDRDIAMAAAIRRRNPSNIGVHEAMSHHVRACLAVDEIGAALKQMENARVRRLPVLDATGHLTGILSIDDIVLRAVGQEGGVTSAEFVKALRAICSQPAREPEVDVSETFVSG